MGRFRQTTLDQWNAAGHWLRHATEGERLEDYTPDNLAATMERKKKPSRAATKKTTTKRVRK